jgi:hypothetical protein
MYVCKFLDPLAADYIWDDMLFLCVCMCVYVYMHVCIRISGEDCIRDDRVFMCMYVCMYVYACIYVCMCVPNLSKPYIHTCIPVTGSIHLSAQRSNAKSKHTYMHTSNLNINTYMHAYL